MKRNPDLYRASVRVVLYRGPSYVKTRAFRVPRIPQDGLMEAWLDEFTDRLRETVATLCEAT